MTSLKHLIGAILLVLAGQVFAFEPVNFSEETKPASLLTCAAGVGPQCHASVAHGKFRFGNFNRYVVDIG